MQHINHDTVRGGGFVRRWNASEDVELQDVYGRCSDAKRRAYDYCRNLFECTTSGNRFRIISHNSQTFTCAWGGVDDETGEIGVFVETAYNSYFIPYAKALD